MLLHGLTEKQVQEIEQTRKLVREVTIYAPILHEDNSLHLGPHDDVGQSGGILLPPSRILNEQVTEAPTLLADGDGKGDDGKWDDGHVEAEFLVTELNVNRGESVEAGQNLGRLSDYSQVMIEGHAFEKDASALRAAATKQLSLQAVVSLSGADTKLIDNLKIAYIGNEIDLQSRVLPFYVAVQNEIERSTQWGELRFVSWRFKPGQRLQIRVPLSSYERMIVLPRDAVAEEGAERYVFIDHGDHLDRRSVRVKARDTMFVAIVPDGSIKVGERIAINAAHSLQMEIKNNPAAPSTHTPVTTTSEKINRQRLGNLLAASR